MPTLGNKIDRRSLRPLPVREAGADCSGFLQETERRRINAFGGLEKGRRSAFGQFATPAAIAVRMAAMFEAAGGSIRLLAKENVPDALHSARRGWIRLRPHWRCNTAGEFSSFSIVLRTSSQFLRQTIQRGSLLARLRLLQPNSGSRPAHLGAA
jgi:hypothetical protein